MKNLSETILYKDFGYEPGQINPYLAPLFILVPLVLLFIIWRILVNPRASGQTQDQAAFNDYLQIKDQNESVVVKNQDGAKGIDFVSIVENANREDTNENQLKGEIFEKQVCIILQLQGYTAVRSLDLIQQGLYKPSGYDDGLDVIATKVTDGNLTELRLIQCKCHKEDIHVDNSPIQEIVTAARGYMDQLGLRPLSRPSLEVWTTAKRFTPAAKALAQQNGVRLLQSEEIKDEVKAANYQATVFRDR